MHMGQLSLNAPFFKKVADVPPKHFFVYFIKTKDNMIAVMITLHSCKILSHSIV